MAIYLVQHGKCFTREEDPDRALTKEGKHDCERIAKVAKGYNIPVSKIIHSGKKRAVETSEIFAHYLGAYGGLHESDKIAPNDEVEPFSNILTANDNRMIVGHLPFLGKLVSYMLTGSTDKTVFKFQNGGILCLDRDSDSHSWIIKWALMPLID